MDRCRHRDRHGPIRCGRAARTCSASSSAIDLADGADQLAYILHRGDTKDPGPDQFLVFDTYGHEVWQLQGADPEKPYVAPPAAMAAGP